MVTRKYTAVLVGGPCDGASVEVNSEDIRRGTISVQHDRTPVKAPGGKIYRWDNKLDRDRRYRFHWVKAEKNIA